MILSAYDIIYNALANMPIMIHIDEQKNCYHIRDNSCNLIWADDLSEMEFVELLQDMVLSIKSRYPNSIKVESIVEQLVQAYQSKLDKAMSICTDTKVGQTRFVEIQLRCGCGYHISEIMLNKH